MANSKFIKIQSEDPEINRIQDQVIRGTNQTSTVGNGALIQGVSLVSGSAQNVAHQLGRPLLGAFVTKSSGPARYTIQSSSLDASRYVSVTADANVTVDLWVF